MSLEWERLRASAFDPNRGGCYSQVLGSRITELDGLRGLATLTILFSHYFGEVPHGILAAKFGWMAVRLFFVLSGFLVGRLILERKDSLNFFTVFYMRRVCRTVPVYFFCVILIYGIISLLGERSWTEFEKGFPLWSYLTFTQNFFMIEMDNIGPHWLAPTWTLVIEEQFYLVIPTLFFLIPRRLLILVLLAGALIAVGFRTLIFQGGWFTPLVGQVLLVSSADALFFGLMAGVIFKTRGIDWERWSIPLRLVPMLGLVATSFTMIAGGIELLASWGFFFVSASCAAYILCIALNVPESRFFRSPLLCFFGDISYSVYLTHLAVLGLIHGVIFQATPDIATWPQLMATFVALPIAVFIGWLFTQIIERPITAYGRSWRWRAPGARPFLS